MIKSRKAKGWLILGGVLAAAVLAGAAVLAANPGAISSMEDWYRQLGATEGAGSTDSAADEIYMQGDTITLYTSEVEQRTQRYALFQKENPEEEAVQSLLADLAFEKAARDAGYTVTDQEVDQYLQEMRESIRQAENYADYLTYIEGTGMTEDAYWESMAPLYKREMLKGKYLNPLYEQFYQDHAGEEDVAEQWAEEQQKMAEKILKEDHVKRVN